MDEKEKLATAGQLERCALGARSAAGLAAQAAAEAIAALAASKQDKLTGQPGQVVGFDGMGLACAVRGWSSPNLLDNWYFADPVNQRGKKEYTEFGYTIDRWKSVTAKSSIRVTGKGLRIVAKDTIDLILDQLIEDDWLEGKTVTLSALVSEHVKGSLAIQNSATQKNITGTGLVSVTGVYGKADHSFRMYNQEDSDFTVLAVKMELGSRQTLACQDADGRWVLNDTPPNKALELLKCQRYYEICAVQGIASSSGLLDLFVPYKVTKRAAPAVTVQDIMGNADSLSVWDGAVFSSHAASAADVNTDRKADGVRVLLNDVRGNSALSGKIIADANL